MYPYHVAGPFIDLFNSNHGGSMSAASAMFSCDACNRQFRWKPELAGKRVKCKCSAVVVVPENAPSETSEPPRPQPPKAAPSKIPQAQSKPAGSAASAPSDPAPTSKEITTAADLDEFGRLQLKSVKLGVQMIALGTLAVFAASVFMYLHNKGKIESIWIPFGTWLAGASLNTLGPLWCQGGPKALKGKDYMILVFFLNLAAVVAILAPLVHLTIPPRVANLMLLGPMFAVLLLVFFFVNLADFVDVESLKKRSRLTMKVLVMLLAGIIVVGMGANRGGKTVWMDIGFVATIALLAAFTVLYYPMLFMLASSIDQCAKTNNAATPSSAS